MQMLSTRGAAPVSPSMAILRGLAPDGGLYVPAQYPSFSAADIEAMAGMNYRERALAVLTRFLPDFTREELAAALEADEIQLPGSASMGRALIDDWYGRSAQK